MAIPLSEFLENNQANDEPKVMALGDFLSTEPVQVGTELFTKFSPEEEASLKAQGKIGAYETAIKKDALGLIPFAGGAKKGMESVSLLNSINRLQNDDYENLPGYKNKDITKVSSYLRTIEEERIRGRTIPGMITAGVMELPAFMLEFLATGGLAAIGRKGAQKATLKTMNALTKKGAIKFTKKSARKFVSATTGRITSATVRTALMPHRVVESFAERQANSKLDLTEKGWKILNDSPERPMTSLLKGFGDVWVENFSEEIGSALTAGGKKIIGKLPSRFTKAVTSIFKKLNPNKEVSILATKLGWNGFIEEMGEERFGALMRAVFNIEDFGAENPDKILDRVIASIPNGEELLVEAGVLAFPGATNFAAQQTVKMIKDKKARQIIKGEIEKAPVLDKPLTEKELIEVIEFKREEVEPIEKKPTIKPEVKKEIKEIKEKRKLTPAEQIEVQEKVTDIAIKGRLQKLDNENEAILKQIDDLEIQRKRFIKQDLSTKAIDTKIKKLITEQEYIDSQRAEILIEQKEKLDLAKEKIIITPEKLETTLLKEKIANIRRGIREGKTFASKEIKSVQSEMINILETSDLIAKDKAKFIKTIKNVQTVQQLNKAMPEILDRISKLEELEKGRVLKKKILKQPKKPQIIIDIEYQKKINEILSTLGRTKAERKKGLKNLSNKQLEEMAIKLAEYKAIGRGVFASKKAQADMASEVLKAGLISSTGGLKSGLFAKGSIEERKAKRATGLKKADILFKRPIEFIRSIFGKLGERVFYDSIDAADMNKSQQSLIRNQKIKDAMSKNNIKLFELGRVVTIGGKSFQVNNILRMYMATKDQQSYDALKFGNNLTDAEITAFIEHVKENSPAYLKFADEVQEVIGERVDSLADTMEQVFNVQMERVKSYFPLRRISFLSEEELSPGIEAEMITEQALRKGKGFSYTSTEKGFTISRQDINEKYQTEISLDFLGDALRAITQQEHFIAYSPLQKSFNKIINDPELQEAVKYNHSESAWKAFNEYLNVNINPATVVRGGVESGFLRNIRLGLSKAYLMFNAVTALKQFPSAVLALKYTTPQQLILSMNKIAFSKEARENVYKLDPSLKNRVISRDFNDLMAVIKTLPESDIKRQLQIASASVDKAGFAMIMQMDKYAVLSVYDAVYQQQRKTKSENEARDLAHKAVIETQPQGGVKDLPTIYRTNSEFLRMTLMFTNQLNQIWNMVRSGLPREIAAKQYGRATTGIASIMFSSFMIFVMSHGRPPENEDEWFDAMLGNILSSVPILGNWSMAMVRGFDPSISPAQALVDNIKWTIGNIKNENYVKAMDKALFLVAVLAKLPYSQPKRTIKGARRLLEGNTADFRELIWSEQSLSGKNATRRRR